MKELVVKINEAFEAFSKDAALQVEKGNKAAGTRARKASLELRKVRLEACQRCWLLVRRRNQQQKNEG